MGYTESKKGRSPASRLDRAGRQTESGNGRPGSAPPALAAPVSTLVSGWVASRGENKAGWKTWTMALYLITPLMGWTWPSLLPVAIAVAAGYGYKKLTGIDEKAWLRGRLSREMENLKRVSLPIDELIADVVGEEVGRDQRLVFKKDDYRLIFRRDPEGHFFVDVLGPRQIPSRTLREEALAFARELVQQFVYNRVVREMEARGIHVLQETTEEETGDIILEARRWR